jgi:hypothetical protein
VPDPLLKFYDSTSPLFGAARELHHPLVVLDNYMLNEFGFEPEFAEFTEIVKQLMKSRARLDAYLAGPLQKALKARAKVAND